MGSAHQAQGAGNAATAVRLSASRAAAGSPGHQAQPQESLSAVQGGTSDGAQARRPQAGAGDASPDDDPARSESTLVD